MLGPTLGFGCGALVGLGGGCLLLSQLRVGLFLMSSRCFVLALLVVLLFCRTGLLCLWARWFLGVEWFRLGSRLGFVWLPVVSGCVMSSGLRDRFVVPRRRVVPERRLELLGALPMGSVRGLVGRVYGLRLVVPSALLGRVVDLPGSVSRSEFRDWLESELSCQVVEAGGTWTLVDSGDSFSVVMPDVLGGLSSGGVQRVEAGGRVVASGPYGELSRFRRLLAVAVEPRAVVRVRLVVLDVSRASSLGLVADPFSVAYQSGWVSGWDPTLVLSLFRESGSVLNEFGGLLTEGGEYAYRDQVEQRFVRYVSGDSGRVFESGFDTVSAGLTVSLRGVQLDGVWRVTGQLELSDFRGGGAGVPERVSRSVAVDLDLACGSVVRLATVSVERGSGSLGLQSNRPSLAGSRSGSVASVWVVLEAVPQDEVMEDLSPPRGSDGL